MNKLFYIHIIISVVYVLFTIISKSEEKLFRLFIIVLIPYFGLLFFLIVDMAFLLRKGKDMREDCLDVLKIVKNNIYLSNTTIDFETNEEDTYMALSDINGINDSRIRRRKIFDEINGDIEKTSPYIKEFLKDQDSEITHYTAAIITGTLQKTNKLYHEARLAYQNDEGNVQIIAEYIKTILQYINLGIFQEDEVLQKRKEFSKVFEEYANKASRIEENIYVEAIENELKLDKVARAIDILDKYCEYYSKSEKSDYMILKILYIMGDYKSFNKHLDFIKNKGIDLSNEFHQIISFWKEAC
jgi:hypothetical protein